MKKIKILIVEDESIVALEIKRNLEKIDCQVTNTVTNYEEAMQSVNQNTPHLILMDVNLGEKSKNGIETMKDIHELFPIPVIFLTAFSDDITMEKIFEVNPVAYLVKPFKREDLKASIKLAIHKIKASQLKDVVVDLGSNYKFDLKNNHLFYEDEPIKLSSKEQILLNVLIQAKGYIVPFDELEFNIWPNEPVSQSALRTLIYRLRAKLECELIETIPSFGCKLLKNL